MSLTKRKYNGEYSGDNLNQIAFPMGGIGAGMLCLEGNGQLSNFSLRHSPDVFNQPLVFSALSIKGNNQFARVLEGPIPKRKVFGGGGSGNGLDKSHFGFPRFSSALFKARFPFGTVELQDDESPIQVSITGWSPFVPLDSDISSLPVAGLEFNFTNNSSEKVEAIYSFHSENFIKTGKVGDSVGKIDGGFVLSQAGNDDEMWKEGHFAVSSDDPETKIDPAWFRGAWFDSRTLVWKNISEEKVVENDEIKDGKPSPGASLYIPFELLPGESKTLKIMFAWHVPHSKWRIGKSPEDPQCSNNSCCGNSESKLPTYEPYYADKFQNIGETISYWIGKYSELKHKTEKFTNCFFDSTLPQELLEAVSANLSILKSPTVLRQKDGRLWAWEGCCDAVGCCHGSCTHVWNYAQALPHLFPDLEQSLRETEFLVAQDENGHQNFRVPLPIRPPEHNFHAAADGQLGGIMKACREWKISGDTNWLRSLWPKIKSSLDYCINTWDPDHIGILSEPHHNTYDIEFWGSNGMCGSLYLGALKAAASMAEALGEANCEYHDLLSKGKAHLEGQLFNGEYFEQHIKWEGLRSPDPTKAQNIMGDSYSPEARELLEKEGPKYQYGTGCLADGVIGAWMAKFCGVGEILDKKLVLEHLRSVHRYNLKKDLSKHANPQRPGFALAEDGGLLLCTWPKGGALSLPFVYSDEVWTGIEYQVASHLISVGETEAGLEIVRTARNRYDGRCRNPFNEYECGHWYARALSSYALIEAYTGIKYDATQKKLYIDPNCDGDFKTFFSTASGYGTVGVKDGEVFLEMLEGRLDIEEIVFNR